MILDAVQGTKKAAVGIQGEAAKTTEGHLDAAYAAPEGREQRVNRQALCACPQGATACASKRASTYSST